LRYQITRTRDMGGAGQLTLCPGHVPATMPVIEDRAGEVPCANYFPSRWHFWAGVIALSGLPHGAVAEKRVALVVGNSAYQYAPKLTNPRNDATDIAAALKKTRVRCH